jgi:ferredoxin
MLAPETTSMKSKTVSASGSARLKIHIDRERCQGHAHCVAIAPGLFELDEFNQACATGNGTVQPGLEEDAWLAAAHCPTSAIQIRTSDFDEPVTERGHK